MDAIAEYVRSVAFYMVFASLVEIVAPSGGFKKYIRLITSLILIALIIRPFGELFGGGATRPDAVFGFNSLIDEGLPAKRYGYEKQQAEAVVVEYKKNLAEQAKQVIESQTGLAVSSVDVAVNEDYESAGFASVLGVDAVVTLPYGAGDVSRLKKILLGNADGQATRAEIDEAVRSRIKNSLNGFYNVPESNIHIEVLDN